MAQQCTATASSTGKQCARYAIEGATVCRAHGGAAPQVRQAAARRREEQEQQAALRRGLAEAYGDDVPNIDPGEAMLRAVSWKYAECVALRRKVAELDDDERTWGTTKVKTGGDDDGVTEEAKPHILWAMLQKAEEMLVRFAAAAHAAGCNERQVRIAEAQGDLVATAITRILDALDLTPEQQQRVPEVVPAQLRLVAGGAA